MQHMKARYFSLLVLTLVLTASCIILQGCDQPGNQATEATYADIKEWMADDTVEMTIIDVRPESDYTAGHIQDAIHIDLATFVDSNGNLLNEGEALTSVVTDKDRMIVTYCVGYGKDKTFAETAVDLGYTDVHYYTGGTEDWSANGDYYVIEYAAFKTWHDAKHPFDDGKNFLFDVLPVDWYTGDDLAHPGGHIPGAINLPIETWYANGNLVESGKVFTDIVTDKTAKVIIYCGDPACGKSLSGAIAAVGMGYTNVFRFQGGQQVWRDNGNDLTPGAEP